MTYEELINSPAGEFVMFASKDGKVRIECRFESDTLWLSQATICELYGKAKATISGISRIFLMRVNWSKIQLFGFTEQLPAME
ncbi:hypothetical protein BFV67_00350 [Enterobacter roggenkampii]|uniref:hypothetical protein n=1 Tax=Enterobacter roggenkampii TaxID=1812935 RepID=UPI00084CD9F1|nr:hypothetical protein BFV67_00350 [Enterobacter roggenkampii]